MKDKLTKFNHKRPYYLIRLSFNALSFAIFLSLMILLPVGLVIITKIL